MELLDQICYPKLLDQICYPKYNSFLIPVFFTPLGDCFLRNKKSANLANCTPAHEEIFVKCWESNVETYKQTIFNGAKRVIMPFLGGLFYLLYYRWREKREMFQKILTKVSGIRK